jgi:hypothetical protein
VQLPSRTENDVDILGMHEVPRKQLSGSSILRQVMVASWFVWAIGGFLLVPQRVFNLFSENVYWFVWFTVTVATYVGYWAYKGQLKHGLLLALRCVVVGLLMIAFWGSIFYLGSVFLGWGVPQLIAGAAAFFAVLVLGLFIGDIRDDVIWARGYSLSEQVDFLARQLVSRVLKLGLIYTVAAAFLLWVALCWWFFMKFVEWPNVIAKIATAASLLLNLWLAHWLIDRWGEMD